MTDLQKEQLKINKLTCPIYRANSLHTVDGCTWGGSKKFNIDPQIVSVHCEGLMHSWEMIRAGLTLVPVSWLIIPIGCLGNMKGIINCRVRENENPTP